MAGDAAGNGPGPGTADDEIARGRRIGVGCFTTFIGFWSGGMIGVLIGKVVGGARGCVPIEGTPACDWYYFAAVGMIIGAVSLPVLVLRRLGRNRKP
ncbi:MAG: hypothetical protein HUU26_13055 [Gemmatimonadaceae bacterium]|nr:hypothetical protein [Gemmatimonadaceae bacterium]